MNSTEMIDENIRIASDAVPGQFTDSDFELVGEIKEIIRESEKVGCTGCGYCMPCPKGIDIPGYFHYYNLMYIDKKGSARFEFSRAIAMRKDPAFASKCIGCGKCAKNCASEAIVKIEG